MSGPGATDAAASTEGDERRTPRRPAWAIRRPSPWTLATCAAVALAFAATLPALFRYQGSPMEEGFMLAFPEQILDGRVPHRDFLHLYGPGSLYALAGWYKVFGVSITAERVFGAGQLAGIVIALMALARPWGRWASGTVGLMAVWVTTTAVGLTALAWNGAVALAAASLWVLLRARRWLTDDTIDDVDRPVDRVDRLLAAAGLLAGLALVFRPDVVVAVALSTVIAGWGLSWARQRRWLLGFVAGCTPYLVLLATAGPQDSFRGMFLEPVFELRDGRSLPRPPRWDGFDGALAKVAALRPGMEWPIPGLNGPQQAFVWFFLLPATALLIAVLGVRRIRSEQSWEGSVMLAVGGLSLGLLPQALQRPDTTHLAWVSAVPIAFLPVALIEAFGQVPIATVARRATAFGITAALAVPLLVIPQNTARTYVDLVHQSVPGVEIFGYPVSRNGRTFYLGAPDIAPVVQRMLDEIGPQTTPGQRLFVGTADLRKTPYSDAYLYYLFPELVPATRYIEMDPGVANAPDSGLAEEVGSADWLLLSHIWDPWDEPNASKDFGPDAPNEVVRQSFCPVGDYGPYFEVYRRCDDR